MKVFLVDDDELVLFVMGSILEEGGHEVRQFANPHELLDALDDPPDLVISDVSMPQMDGFELARRVSEQLGVSPPRTLLVSAEPHGKKLQKVGTEEVIGLVRKPFRAEWFIQVAGLLANSRDCCPCVVKDVDFGQQCDHSWEDVNGPEEDPVCWSAEYAICSVYDELVGQPLRHWISCSGCV